MPHNSDLQYVMIKYSTSHCQELKTLHRFYREPEGYKQVSWDASFAVLHYFKRYRLRALPTKVLSLTQLQDNYRF